MKFYILIIFKKSFGIFLCPTGKLSPYKDLSWDRLSDWKFRKWLVFNHEYAGSVI